MASIPSGRRGVWLKSVTRKHDKNVCQLCGKKLKLREVTIDHIIPRSRGGNHTLLNLMVACQPCNVRKGHKIIQGKFLDRERIRQAWICSRNEESLDKLFEEVDYYLANHGPIPSLWKFSAAYNIKPKEEILDTPTTKSLSIWIIRQIRYTVRWRHKNTCQSCGTTKLKDKESVLKYITPPNQGGVYTSMNLTVICEPCDVLEE